MPAATVEGALTAGGGAPRREEVRASPLGAGEVVERGAHHDIGSSVVIEIADRGNRDAEAVLGCLALQDEVRGLVQQGVLRSTRKRARCSCRSSRPAERRRSGRCTRPCSCPRRKPPIGRMPSRLRSPVRTMGSRPPGPPKYRYARPASWPPRIVERGPIPGDRRIRRRPRLRAGERGAEPVPHGLSRQHSVRDGVQGRAPVVDVGAARSSGTAPRR